MPTTEPSSPVSPAPRAHSKSSAVHEAPDHVSPPQQDIPIEHLFTFHRLKRPLRLLPLALFGLWFPFGLCLAAFRLLVILPFYFALIFVVPNIKWCQRIQFFFDFFLFGAIFRYKNKHYFDDRAENCRLLVFNHITELDGFLPRQLCFRPGSKDRVLMIMGDNWTKLPLGIGKYLKKTESKWGLLFVKLVRSDADGHTGHAERKQNRESIERSLKSHPKTLLVAMPEGGLTNGKGLLQFKKFIFSLGHNVVPAAITLRDIWPIEPDLLTDPTFANLLLFLTQPFNIIDVSFCEPMSEQPDESDHAFAARVQHRIARELGPEVVPTTYHYKEKVRYIQQLSAKKKAEGMSQRLDQSRDVKAGHKD